MQKPKPELIIYAGEDWLKIFFCKKCRVIDYSDGKCPKCGSFETNEASLDFLLFGKIKRDTTKISENIDYCAKWI